ncbi:MAG: hypothetical protein AB7E70_02825 [Hyphomicrobiaceae bacterium]
MIRIRTAMLGVLLLSGAFALEARLADVEAQTQVVQGRRGAAPTATPRAAPAAPRQSAPRQIAPRQIAPRRAVPRQAVPRRVVPRQVTPRRAVPRAVPRRVVPRKVTPRRVVPRVTPPTGKRARPPRRTIRRHRAWRPGLRWRWIPVPTIIIAEELNWCHYHRWRVRGMHFHRAIRCHRHARWNHPAIRYVTGY